MKTEFFVEGGVISKRDARLYNSPYFFKGMKRLDLVRVNSIDDAVERVHERIYDWFCKGINNYE